MGLMRFDFWFRRASLATGLVIVYVFLMTGFNIWKPRVLILHSFSQSLRLVKDTDAGMREALSVNRMPISVRWYYLNRDRNDVESMGNAELTGAERVINSFNPTVIVAVNNQANLVLSHYPYLHRDRLVFFLGNSRPALKFGYSSKTGVAGIEATPPFLALAQLFAVIRPAGGLRIVALGTNTPRGRDTAEGITTFQWGPQRLVASDLIDTWPQWQAAVLRANQQADILLITAIYGVHRSPNGALVPAEEVVRWTEAHSKKALPVGLIGDYVPLGGSLGVFPSAHYLGAMAMESVLKWLDPSNKRVPPIIPKDDHFDIGLREVSLRSRGLQLPLVYREAARLSGQLNPVEGVPGPTIPGTSSLGSQSVGSQSPIR